MRSNRTPRAATESPSLRKAATTSTSRARERRRDALERLVEQQQASPAHERARERDELLLAARELEARRARERRAPPG